METISSILSWILQLLSLPVPGGGFFIVVAIIVTWLLNRSKFKSAKAKERELGAEIDGLKHNLDINRKIHEEGERSLMEKNTNLQKELEDARSEVRILSEKPDRREIVRLKRCEQVAKELALCDLGDQVQLDRISKMARVELVECPVENSSTSNRKRFRLALPWVGRKC